MNTTLTTPHFDWKMVVRFLVLGILMPMILFVSAGRLDWWQGWVYMVLSLAPGFISRYILFLKHPELITERARFTESEGVKDWDKKLVLWIAIVGPLFFMITAGFDKRFGWTGELGLGMHLGAAVIFILGYSLATWAMIENQFFSSVVRIQTERGHSVVTTGPYRFVRHPGYSGGLLAWLVSPLVLGSLWSFIPVVVIALLYIVRTVLEDRTLRAELPGYAEYAQHTRYRLIPGIW